MVPAWELRAGLEVGSLGFYRGALRQAVLRIKERNDLALLGVLAGRLAALLQQHCPGPVQVVGVPTSARRQRWRGYCAPGRLAARLGAPLLADFHCLGDPAPRKALRGFQARRAHKSSFVYRGRLQGTVVLLDDVITSGQTLRQARQALLAAGAERVVCLCVARAARAARAGS
ncbi:hypothetical protein ABS71_21910 [bacterium SCN 62-11]|nr:MAG: hypothetical protein ABS71_21910 [bacterium SCN 62-11]